MFWNVGLWFPYPLACETSHSSPINNIWDLLSSTLTRTSYINLKKTEFPAQETMLKKSAIAPGGSNCLIRIKSYWKFMKSLVRLVRLVCLFSFLNAFEIKRTHPNPHLNRHSVKKVCNLNPLYVAIWSWSRDICSE